MFFRGVNRVIDGGTERYLRGAARRSSAASGWWRWCSSRCSARRTGSTRACRPAFVPDEDQGYLIVIVQAPEGASLDYTMNIVKQVEADRCARCRRSSTCSRSAASASAGSSPNRGTAFAQLKDFEERRGAEQSAQAVVGQLFGTLQRHHAARWSFRSCRRRSRASASSAASRSSCSTRAAGRSRTSRAATRDLIAPGQPDAGLTALFTQFTANDPQLVVDIDREQAKASAVGSATSRARCRSCWDRRTSTTSTSTTGRTASTCRPISSSDRTPADIERYYVARRRRRHDAARATSSPVKETTAPQTHHPLQPVPIGGDQRRPRRPATARARRCRSMEQSGRPDAAAGHDVRVVGAVARGDAGRQPGGRHLRPRPAARLPDAGGAVREPARCRSSSCCRCRSRSSARCWRSGAAG